MAIFYEIYTAEAYGATSIVVCIYHDWGVNAYGATSIVVAHLRGDHVVFVLVAIMVKVRMRQLTVAQVLFVLR